MSSGNGKISLELLVGLAPAPLELMQALQTIQVTRGETAPSTFQITFHVERVAGSNDFPLVVASTLQPFARITLMVTVLGTPRVLIDGYITHQQLTPAPAPGGTTLTVIGEDVSVKMGLIEISFEYPHMGDFLVAEAVLAKYEILNISADVKPTIKDIIPFDWVPQQNCTDRDYLQTLAAPNGYRFYIIPGPTAGKNTAYWGPPVTSGTPQLALNVDMGPSTNIQSINFNYNALAPTMTWGAVQQPFIPPVPVPIVIAESTRSPPLAEKPALPDAGNVLSELVTDPIEALKKLIELGTRASLFQHQGMGVALAGVLAQSQTDQSTDEVVTVTGRLETARYGQVLDAPGLVAVRGAGNSYDGLYYVKKVEHKMNTVQGSWWYTQDFTLTREGTGSTIQEAPNHEP